MKSAIDCEWLADVNEKHVDFCIKIINLLYPSISKKFTGTKSLLPCTQRASM